MGLSLNKTKFFTMIPKMPYTFYASFLSNQEEELPDLGNFKIVSISLPKVEIEKDNKYSLGNTQIVYPIYKWASRKISITFEETDDYSVVKALDNLIENENQTRYQDIITSILKLNEYNTNFTNVSTRYFVCKLISFNEPDFTRTGNPMGVTVNADFTVLAEIDSSEVSSYFSKLVRKPSNNFIDDNIKNEDDIDKSRYSDFFNLQANQLKVANGNMAQLADCSTGGTKDFNVTQEEMNNIKSKIKSETAVDVSDEVLTKVLTSNAQSMDVAYNTFKQKLAAAGINISINAYNDTGHSVGLGTNTGSHLLGQKIDLNFTDKNNKKLTYNNITAEQKCLINRLAAESGLVANYESNDTSTDSFWGDFSLAKAMSVDKNGNLVNNQIMHAWSSDKVYDTKKDKKVAFRG